MDANIGCSIVNLGHDSSDTKYIYVYVWFE